MSELNASAVDLFVAAAESGAQEAAAAFQRTFGQTITLAPSGGEAVHAETFLPKVAGKGLALLLYVGGRGIAILLGSSTGLVPDWCDEPDATGKSKLSTFAQEWGMNLVPEDFFPEDFKAGILHDLAQGLVRAEMALDAGYLELSVVNAQGESAPIYLVWALEAPDKFYQEEVPAEDVEPIPGLPTFGAPSFGGDPSPAGFDPFATQSYDGPREKRPSLDDLPGYARSMLKVKIPVAAVLATARKPIKSILELGVGSVIQFDKSCDELLDVEVGQSVVIGKAEAVKVGDKFGFRINTILLPDERFRKVEVRREGEYRVKHDSPQIIGKAPIKSFD